jgi:putative transcriptional regulator
MSLSENGPTAVPGHAIEVHLDELLIARGMTLTELAEHAQITIANLSILKNGHARAIRFSTLTKLCGILRCQPGDLITYSSAVPPPAARTTDDG